MTLFLGRASLVGASVFLAFAACHTTDRPDETTSAPQRSNTPPDGTASSPSTSTEDGGSTSPDDAPTKLTAESVDVGGAPRSYMLAKPVDYSPGRKYPLVLVLHGDGGDGAGIRAAVGFERASGTDAIVAYPSGYAGWDLYDPPASNPDLAFLVTLVDSLKSRFSIDPDRVYGLGFSSGAFMLNQVACRRPSLFRAIAPHSGGAPSEPKDPAATHWSNDYTRCAGQTLGHGPAVMVIHGTADKDVTYDSGDFTASYWAYIDGCRDTRSLSFDPSPCVAHDGCPTDKPVVLCGIPGLAHTVWSEAASAAWSFFEGL